MMNLVVFTDSKKELIFRFNEMISAHCGSRQAARCSFGEKSMAKILITGGGGVGGGGFFLWWGPGGGGIKWGGCVGTCSC